jgi:hypothetical protein
MADVAVFVSYSHNDDQATYGRIQKFSSDVRSSYKSLSGLDAEMFFDTESIDLGDNWRNRIRSGLLGATILLAYISPLYLSSMACREELQDFISALPDANSRKLIIPLLFTPVNNIEDRFHDDHLWLQIVSLQYLTVHELRTSDPGSSQWMSKVSAIAERMKRAVTVPNTAVPPPAAVVEKESSRPLGTEDLLLVAELKAGMDDLDECANRMAGPMNKSAELLQTADRQLDHAVSFNQRLAVANKLGDDLAPAAELFTSYAVEFQRQMTKVDSGNRKLFSLVRGAPPNGWSDDMAEYIQDLREHASIGLGAFSGIDTFIEMLDVLKGISSNLDWPLQRLKSALLSLSSIPGIYKYWLDEIARLYESH